MQQLLTPKEDWEVKKLGEIFRNYLQDGDLKKNEYILNDKTSLINMQYIQMLISNKGIVWFLY